MEPRTDFRNDNPPIGYVTGGGLEANLQVKLTVPAQTVQEGAFEIGRASCRERVFRTV